MALLTITLLLIVLIPAAFLPLALEHARSG
jgi:hypothetical protein